MFAYLVICACRFWEPCCRSDSVHESMIYALHNVGSYSSMHNGDRQYNVHVPENLSNLLLTASVGPLGRAMILSDEHELLPSVSVSATT